MKFAKLFMAIAVVCLAVACGGNNKSEEAKSVIDPQAQIELAEKAIEDGDYKVAAEAIAKIDATYIAQEIENESPVGEDVAIILFAIAFSGDEEALDIVEKWSEEVESASENLEAE